MKLNCNYRRLSFGDILDSFELRIKFPQRLFTAFRFYKVI